MNNNILTRNAVKVIGNGNKTMFFLHGYGCDQTMWRFMPDAFAENYKLVFLDLVGCGQSDENAYDYEKYSTLDGYVDDLLEICKELDLKDVILVGHSVSANIAILASLKAQELFEKLILICPSPKFINDGSYVGGFTQQDINELIETLESNYLGWSKGIAPVIMGNPDRPELAVELEESFCRNNPDIAKHFAGVTFLCDNRADFKKVKTKTLILQSKIDNLAAIEVGEFVHNSIQNSKMVILDTLGHCPHLSDADKTIPAMNAFLEES